MREDEYDNDSYFNTYIDGGMFYIVNLKTREQIEIQMKNDKQMFISDDARDLMKHGKGYIKYSELNDDIMLFRMDIENNELTKPLYELMKMLNSKVKLTENGDYDYTYEEMTQKVIDILVESKIAASAVAAECIINRLLRSIRNKYERPDFSKYEVEEYEIFSVPRAIEHNGSALLGIAVQQLRRQLLNIDLEKRTKYSYVDVFFNPEIDNLYDELHHLEEE